MAYTDPNEDFTRRVQQRAGGTLMALDERRRAGLPEAQRAGFLTAAMRGLGSGGIAEGAVKRSVGEFESGIEAERQGILRQVMQDVMAERQQEEELELERRRLRAEEEAAKGGRFLGIF